jgi:hypothetical protein
MVILNMESNEYKKSYVNLRFELSNMCHKRRNKSYNCRLKALPSLEYELVQNNHTSVTIGRRRSIILLWMNKRGNIGIKTLEIV